MPFIVACLLTIALTACGTDNAQADKNATSENEHVGTVVEETVAESVSASDLEPGDVVITNNFGLVTNNLDIFMGKAVKIWYLVSCFFASTFCII